ncbi:MAG: DUF2892 domain-containing protein [Bdellovibrionaceae bacterium]|nr:DUF2892 domain-containing protein [Pseudobdellovibrionaceae bacterium]MBX3032354.1 DUF2892 domain-containing protein [Pseudobdellovibrionaceae bacterium]
MRCNLAWWDRLLRFVTGVLLITYALAGGPFWAWGGLYLLATSAWGICAVYGMLKIQTLRERRRPGVP